MRRDIQKNLKNENQNLAPSRSVLCRGTGCPSSDAVPAVRCTPPSGFRVTNLGETRFIFLSRNTGAQTSFPFGSTRRIAVRSRLRACAPLRRWCCRRLSRGTKRRRLPRRRCSCAGDDWSQRHRFSPTMMMMMMTPLFFPSPALGRAGERV